MRLTAPTPITLFISVILALVALAAQYGGVHIPVVQDNVFLTLLAAYVVLFLGNIIRGL